MTRHHIPNIANAVAATLDAIQPRAIDDARLGNRTGLEKAADERFAEAGRTLVNAMFYAEPAAPAVGGLQKMMENWLPPAPTESDITYEQIIRAPQPVFEAVNYSVNQDAYKFSDGTAITALELFESGKTLDEVLKIKRSGNIAF